MFLLNEVYMCRQCNYERLLEEKGLSSTINRILVLKTVGNHPSPLRAKDLYEIISKKHMINRVTIYRILEALVECGLVDRLSTGDRSFRYGLAPNPNHPAHPHFYCKLCGRMECLDKDMVFLDTNAVQEKGKRWVDRAEIRFDGICRDCADQ